MFRLLYRLSTIGTFGNIGFMPPPQWLRDIFSRYKLHKRIIAYSRLLKGQRVFKNVPQEVGCANAVTGVLEMVDPSFFGSHGLVNRIDSTILFTVEMENSKRFIELPCPLDGCIVICTTGTGNGSIIGHTGIYDSGRIWNNNSYTGAWDTSYSMDTWKMRYELRGGFKTRYFFPVENY